MRRVSNAGIAIITGGSRGIGGACVRRFVKFGWSVATVALPGEVFEPTTDGSVLALSGDLASENVCRKLLQRTLERYGRVDVLVNNAGIGM
jgi:NAD(P)-dependent dehydrogenase (short-subunit alcohol dehydrogenase family)